MENIKSRMNFDLNLNTSSNDLLVSSELIDIDPSELEDQEKRIMQWLELNQIAMKDPEEKKNAYFAKKLNRNTMERIKSFTLEKSPLFKRHKLSMSPISKTNLSLTPEKQCLATSNNEIYSNLTKSSSEKLSLEENFGESLRKFPVKCPRFGDDDEKGEEITEFDLE